MTLISYMKKDEATGEVAQIYKVLEERLNILPNVVQLHSASPELFPKVMNFIGHFFDHPSLDKEMIAWTRLLISYHEGGEYCVRFQSSVLNYMGVKKEQLDAVFSDNHNLPLDEKRKQLVLFVLQLMLEKKSNLKEQLSTLLDLGWTEKDVYEICVMAALQKGMVKVIAGFQLDFDF